MRPYLLLLLLFFSWSSGLYAKPIPDYVRPVVDETGLLSTVEIQGIETLLNQLHDEKKAAFAVYLVGSLEGREIEDYAEEVFRKWKLGTKGKDEGLLLLVAPSERKMRLEVGYGLEGELTDAYCKRILDHEVRPFFKDDRYADGITMAVFAVGNKLGAIFSSAPPEKPTLWSKLRANPNFQRVAWITLVPALLVCFLGLFDKSTKTLKAWLLALLVYLFLSGFLGVFFFVGLEEKSWLFLFIPGIFYLLIFVFPLALIALKFLFPKGYQKLDAFLTAQAKERERSGRSLGKTKRGASSSHAGGGFWSGSAGSYRSSGGSSFSGGGSSGGGGASSSW